MNYQDSYNIVTDKEYKEREHKEKERREKERKETKNERRKQNKHDKHDDTITKVKEVPVTMERKVPHDLEESLGNAGLPRATIAATKEVPKGSSGKPTNKSVLQQHIQYFDTDHDNIIYPLDTWRGLRKLGFSIPYTALSVFVTHVGFAYPSQKSWIPFLGNPLFKIYVERIYKDKHGSDSESYDTEGRFVPEKFEEIFSKYDSDNKGGLNFNDVVSLIRGNANAFDPFGWMCAIFEWGTLYLLCAQNGIITKEDARTCLDGTLFFRMAESEEKRQKGIGINAVLKSLKEE